MGRDIHSRSCCFALEFKEIVMGYDHEGDVTEDAGGGE